MTALKMITRISMMQKFCRFRSLSLLAGIVLAAGGLSGPAVRPVAVRMVYQTAKAVKIPIVGLGGIEKLDDALQFFIAGASAVQIGTATFYEPRTAETIAEGLERYMAENGFASVADLRGDF